ncbi:uncharacterized protein LOC118202355 [Stegodyphus dumicola]|uniref:uncharacterized protein LOC118202355 n=1 Tax=Stegodyphus dumicola TaxID=202533 RepID=UPI0015A9F7C0|nr:uncharacterized protein LOC118202355 [Stegodyphus dumicola]
MNFKRNNIDSVPKRRATERSFGGKENNSMSNSRNPSSTKVEQIFNEVRISACKTISNVKCSFDDLSQKLRRNTKRARNMTKMQQYEELNEQVTPVKLYSPFTFVTPSPKSSRKTRSPKR